MNDRRRLDRAITIGAVGLAASIAGAASVVLVTDVWSPQPPAIEPIVLDVPDSSVPGPDTPTTGPRSTDQLIADTIPPSTAIAPSPSPSTQPGQAEDRLTVPTAPPPPPVSPTVTTVADAPGDDGTGGDAPADDAPADDDAPGGDEPDDDAPGGDAPDDAPDDDGDAGDDD